SGFLVDEADDAALAARLIAVLQDVEMSRRLGVGARARAVADFDLRTNTAKLEARYAALSSGASTLLRQAAGSGQS
ncbi:MAG TPA: hypothetical protein VK662_09750, partial [Acidothermaceae bacterium]|nr:hypothetical protein [Acidothermaceae bacterium]